jgi:16S rRNA (cytosine1402-N4)-methyltransferase
MQHIPVLLKETIAVLDPKPNENFIDGTFGFGGHSLAILERTAPRGKILGIELDRESLAALPEEIRQNPRLKIINDSYANIAQIARNNNFENISGILLDLGMSSWHIDASRKGFSFSRNEALDMRFGQGTFDAAKIINEYRVAELEKIIRELGQERYAQKIAKKIENARRQKKIETTAQLVAIIKKTVGTEKATPSLARVFQALRIAVNNELENIGKGIGQGFELLAGGGRMVVISFHSLEDGIVKKNFGELTRSGRAAQIFKKPIVPSEKEIAKNPRARSAKLRAIIKLENRI